MLEVILELVYFHTDLFLFNILAVNVLIVGL